jgi:hypothetical protein
VSVLRAALGWTGVSVETGPRLEPTWRLYVARLRPAATPKVGPDASTAVLDGRVEAHDFPVQVDQLFLDRAAFDLVRVFLQCPWDLDVAACVLAEPDIRGGVMSSVGSASETGCAPVEVVVGRMALTTPREIV